MDIKSKVAKYGERKIIELPKSIRDNFDIGEEIIIKKNEGNKHDRGNKAIPKK